MKCPSVLKWYKKHSPKQVIPVTHTLEERFFATAIFKCLWSLLFRHSKKRVYTLVRMHRLYISREEGNKKIIFMRNKFSFPYEYI